MYHILRDDEYVASAATVQDAVAYCEDDAVEAWDRMRDPNQPGAQLFPGVHWSMGAQHVDEGILEIGKGCIKYGIIDPVPFATHAMVMYDGYPCVLIIYDNQACDYAYSQEFCVWL